MLERGQTGCSKLSGLLWGSLSSPAYALSSPSHLSHCRGQGGRLPRALNCRPGLWGRGRATLCVYNWDLALQIQSNPSSVQCVS